MGQRDYCLKRYLSDETRFADLINGILGEGEQLISPSDLTEMDSQVDPCQALSPCFTSYSSCGSFDG